MWWSQIQSIRKWMKNLCSRRWNYTLHYWLLRSLCNKYNPVNPRQSTTYKHIHEGGDSEHPYLQTRRMVSLKLSSSIHTLVQREASRQWANRKTFIRFLGHITDYMHLRQSAPQHTAHNMTTSRTRTHKALRKLESNHDSLVKDWTLHSRVWLLLTKPNGSKRVSVSVHKEYHRVRKVCLLKYWNIKNEI